jgi:phosphatidylserine decarboxylase
MSNLLRRIQFLLPQHFLSRFVGFLAESGFLKNILIRTFVRTYKVDMSEALNDDLSEYKNFNTFFTRELKTNARPFDSNSNTIVSPADGKISALGEIIGAQLLQAKEHYFSTHDLLGGNHKLAKQFNNGTFATIYLSPKDYHRVHMPISGKLISTIYIPGKLFSVNRITTEALPNLFARNERAVCLFETNAGPMCLILVGAMIVGSIETSWAGQICPSVNNRQIRAVDYNSLETPINLAKGDEAGRFKLGSTAIILFGQGVISLDTKLKVNHPIKMGETLGYIINN